MKKANYVNEDGSVVELDVLGENEDGTLELGRAGRAGVNDGKPQLLIGKCATGLGPGTCSTKESKAEEKKEAAAEKKEDAALDKKEAAAEKAEEAREQKAEDKRDAAAKAAHRR